MNLLSKPTVTTLESFRACIASVRPEKKLLYQKVEKAIIDEADLYDKHAAEFIAYTPNTSTFVGSQDSGINKGEMVALYEQKMAHPKGSARHIYLQLRDAAEECPFCESADADTLDHYLDKAVYPALAISPVNLIPACLRCNKNKNDNLKSHHTEHPIHPYYDDLEAYRWLQAAIIEETPARAQYFVATDLKISPPLRRRIAQQFEILDLDIRFSARFDSLLRGRNKLMRDLFDNTNSAQLRQYILSVEESEREKKQNSWQAVAYAAMAMSDFFCSGRGFLR